MIKLKKKHSLYTLFILLAIALLWNLGVTPISTDEPTRTIVAQELVLNNNYIVPTINGEYYYNKPPIYNWILVGLYEITGSKSEFVARVPVVFSIFLFISTLFLWCRKYMEKELALLVGLVFATGARLLFYDSLLGLIDMFFGWLILLTFILIYELEKKKKYTLLFVSTYIIIAICFLMKGMQALAFQGMTLLGWFIYKRQFKQLFRLPHFAGIGVFVLIIGLYLWVYNQYHPVSVFLDTLWTESSRRTVGGRPWYEDVTHIILFPIKNVFADIFPWGTFLLLIGFRKVRKQVFKHEINRFALLIVLVNLVIYWLSPETRGRYLFPHYALLSIIVVSVLYNFRVRYFIGKKPRKIIHKAILVLIGLTVIAIPVFWFLGGKSDIGNYYIETIPSLVLLMLLFGTAYFINKKIKPYFSIVLILIMGRLIFDAIVLPLRIYTLPFEHYKQEAIRIAKTYHDKPLLIFKYTPIDHSTSHYLLIEQNKITQRVWEKNDSLDAYYLIEKEHLRTYEFEIIDSFPQHWENRTIYIAK